MRRNKTKAGELQVMTAEDAKLFNVAAPTFEALMKDNKIEIYSELADRYKKTRDLADATGNVELMKVVLNVNIAMVELAFKMKRLADKSAEKTGTTAIQVIVNS